MNYPIVKMSDKNDLTGRDFVGVSTDSNEQLRVAVPYGICLPDEVSSTDYANMRFLKIYVKTIQKALNDRFVRSSIENVTTGINHPLAAVNVVYDYITMGALIESEVKEVRSNTGKIDINRTIQKITPTVIGGDMVYTEYITRKRSIIHDSFVATVQGNVINHFMNNGGELLFGTKIKVPVQPLVLNSSIISKLRKELNQTFNSRKQMVIHWMIEYLSGISISDENRGRWNYAIIASTLWEVMVEAVFGNQAARNKTEYGKRYSFHSLVDGKKVVTGRPTEHDTIYETDSEIIIIDAKMYGKDANLLSEEVLGKQFGYYVEAKKKNPQKRVINILLLPSESLSSEEGFADYVILDPHADDSADHDRLIYVYHYSTNKLIEDYYYSRRRPGKIHDDFEEFIHRPHVRSYLNKRGVSYM